MRRCIACWVGCGLFVMAAAPALAQTPYSVPRTPWGDPDLQAIWSGDSAFGIPLQRPAALGTSGERAEDRAVEEDRKKGIIRPRRPIQGGLTVGGQPIPESGPPASQP